MFYFIYKHNGSIFNLIKAVVSLHLYNKYKTRQTNRRTDRQETDAGVPLSANHSPRPVPRGLSLSSQQPLRPQGHLRSCQGQFARRIRRAYWCNLLAPSDPGRMDIDVAGDKVVPAGSIYLLILAGTRRPVG